MSKNRDLILQSAREIFSSRNFEQVTIKEICQHAGVANSTFYYHFKTKEELMDCLRDCDARMHTPDLLNIISAPDLLEQTIAACSMCAVRAERQGCTLTAQYYKRKVDAEDPGDAVRQRSAQERATARAFIERAQQAGVIRNNRPADQLACAALHLTSSIVVEWCAQSGSFDLLERTREFLLVLFNI